ncbi:MAG: hypothetical protein REI09_12490 [Candidatus Dactylopiibacterium sp.]|nr:hypothetical protein [Candidatus Dactylopiibacterium sp.]
MPFARLASAALPGLVALAPAFASASAGAVRPAQIEHLRAGEAETAVLRALGAPLDRPGWMDGSHSLVYAVAGRPTLRVYVDVDARGRVLDVQYGDDGDGSGQ